jgi:uncharacterized protein YceK
MRKCLFSILAVAAGTLSGCCAAFNCLETGKDGGTGQEFGRIYGGLRFEFLAAQSLFTTKDQNPAVTALLACLVAVDTPLTAVADTLMLPYTIPYTLNYTLQQRLAEREAERPSQTAPDSPTQNP